MRKAVSLTCAAFCIAVLAAIGLSQQSSSQDDYAERIAALETRVAVLETAVAGQPSPEQDDANTDDENDQGSDVTEAHFEGNGKQLLGPFSLAEARYRLSYTCHEGAGGAGVAIVTSENGGSVLQGSDDGQAGEQIVTLSSDLDGLYLEINCDADWSFSMVPA
jgi:hypothetical protein